MLPSILTAARCTALSQNINGRIILWFAEHDGNDVVICHSQARRIDRAGLAVSTSFCPTIPA